MLLAIPLHLFLHFSFSLQTMLSCLISLHKKLIGQLPFHMCHSLISLPFFSLPPQLLRWVGSNNNSNTTSIHPFIFFFLPQNSQIEDNQSDMLGILWLQRSGIWWPLLAFSPCNSVSYLIILLHCTWTNQNSENCSFHSFVNYFSNGKKSPILIAMDNIWRWESEKTKYSLPCFSISSKK